MGRLRFGVHAPLEEAANDILFAALKEITSRLEKSDILTTWKEKNRISREVYIADGVPDPALRSGMFHRVLNRAHPHLNSRDGVAGAGRRRDTMAMKHFTGTSDGS